MVVQIPEGARAGDELTITTSNGQDTENSLFLSLLSFCCQVVSSYVLSYFWAKMKEDAFQKMQQGKWKNP